MEVYRSKESEEEVTMLPRGVTMEVTVEEVTVLRVATQQGEASGVRAAKSSEFGEGE